MPFWVLTFLMLTGTLGKEFNTLYRILVARYGIFAATIFAVVTA